ncbi:hypothetical protein CF319_g9550, partial [Tilletia indica]
SPNPPSLCAPPEVKPRARCIRDARYSTLRPHSLEHECFLHLLAVNTTSTSASLKKAPVLNADDREEFSPDIIHRSSASAPLHGGILSTTSTPASLKEASILNARESRPGGTMSDNIHRSFPSQTHPWSTDKSTHTVRSGTKILMRHSRPTQYPHHAHN